MNVGGGWGLTRGARPVDNEAGPRQGQTRSGRPLRPIVPPPTAPPLLGWTPTRPTVSTRSPGSPANPVPPFLPTLLGPQRMVDEKKERDGTGGVRELNLFTHPGRNLQWTGRWGGLGSVRAESPGAGRVSPTSQEGVGSTVPDTSGLVRSVLPSFPYPRRLGDRGCGRGKRRKVRKGGWD